MTASTPRTATAGPDGIGERPGPAGLHAAAQAIADNIGQVLVGKADAVRIALVTLLAEGHLLVEDVPGVGKTSLAKALARSIDCTVSRIQFTPDLLPSDITGVSIYNRAAGDFDFRPGPVFANVMIGDEINRASPKTQSALLECMEERQVTVDGQSYPLTGPFMVIATQNPVEMEGTYPLPDHSGTGSPRGSRWATRARTPSWPWSTSTPQHCAPPVWQARLLPRSLLQRRTREHGHQRNGAA